MGVLLVAAYVSKFFTLFFLLCKYFTLISKIYFQVSDVSDVPDIDDLTSKFKESQGDNSMEFDKTKLTFISEKTATIYEKRMMDIFQDMYNLGYI